MIINDADHVLATFQALTMCQVNSNAQVPITTPTTNCTAHWKGVTDLTFS